MVASNLWRRDTDYETESALSRSNSLFWVGPLYALRGVSLFLLLRRPKGRGEEGERKVEKEEEEEGAKVGETRPREQTQLPVSLSLFFPCSL